MYHNIFDSHAHLDDRKFDSDRSASFNQKFPGVLNSANYMRIYHQYSDFTESKKGLSVYNAKRHSTPRQRREMDTNQKYQGTNDYKTQWLAGKQHG